MVHGLTDTEFDWSGGVARASPLTASLGLRSRSDVGIPNRPALDTVTRPLQRPGPPEPRCRYDPVHMGRFGCVSAGWPCHCSYHLVTLVIRRVPTPWIAVTPDWSSCLACGSSQRAGDIVFSWIPATQLTAHARDVTFVCGKPRAPCWLGLCPGILSRHMNPYTALQAGLADAGADSYYLHTHPSW
ncbi:hypothetical protein BT67DRAFT_54095 [Trichocladium antarcticum]|uniref:Uncharacterized protein n=1 Tax=Trichocladium antarcticum TaxID=1450529 RepID=A0AAN6UKV8_9PEZI|nr:hypothetical protein BT67DRAFT_54095 [Trichocladium antarcticum]